ncbi:MAG: 16S rRNA (adenine(1518)-N(6)/adenine(1519)-N(6))-dimethyltransferase RsmA [Phycisphaerae bacterium]|nr:ribosomal RNA small subunit methyltransferase A [Phycisphaerae bacterium]MCZ2399973.1 16S rRNA (adenine(1518)-N(6)/adenine(1519)-N(6))-dimethyltransferase RsmA [Phycisphaerae bacterium]NUN47489.1 ribosomal RNA small subunit methyltransferase A [Candidatus Brocadiia bacterium]
MPGQTLSEIRTLLAAAGLSPQYRFGQNFLIDLNLMRKLVDAAGLNSEDVVLEVGPGTGSLTELLLASGAHVVAAEIDRGLCDLLRRRLGDHPRFTLVEGDALSTKHQVNPALLDSLRKTSRLTQPAGGRDHTIPLKLVANLPYQVATPLLIELLCGDPPFARLCATIQKEVGQRLAARPATETYGPASVVVQTLARVETLAHLPPEAFWPRPQVHSVMLRLTPLPEARSRVRDAAGLAGFVSRAFRQRRKMLRSSLQTLAAESAALLETAGISGAARAEELTPADWERLFLAWRSSRPGG